MGGREHPVQTRTRGLDHRAGGGEAAECPRRRDHGDLPADDRTDQRLPGIERSGKAHAGRGSDQGGEVPAAGERSIDRHRIGVEVEQATDAAEERRQVPQSRDGHRHRQHRLSLTARLDGTRPEPGRSGGQAEQPLVGPVRASLHAVDRTRGKETEDPVVVRQPHGEGQRQPEGSAGLDGAAVRTDGRLPGCLPHLTRGEIEDLLHRVVELPDAAEPGGEGDVREAQRRTREQGTRRLGAMRPGQGEGAGTEFVLQDAVEVPGGVPDAGSEAGNARPIHLAVGDETHRPRRCVAAEVPFRITRNRLGKAPLAGAVPGVMGGGGRAVEGDVGRHGGPRRA
ncbi:hypothetical protein MN0502_12820 [Arthrobacter sp. MN05-02]|nr:hypothetical protein MN0502_12820 [Arthrobacter sp. MN05-02]